MSCPLRKAFRMPLLVENWIASSGLAIPCCQRTRADAKVACPHRSTSTLGVNQRRSKPPEFLTRNAVSDWFISLATFFRQGSSLQAGKRQTTAGFPAKAWSVKASTRKKGQVALIVLDHRWDS